MLKKYIFAALITLAALPAYSEPEAARQVDSATVVEGLPGGQAEAYIDEAPSKEVDYVVESSTARKMTQAEKAQNAKENDSTGGAITIIAMSIVLICLIVLSILFLGFGKVSSMLLSRQKRKAITTNPHTNEEDHADLDSGEVIAAIAAALSEHFDRKHDIEDTILTIRRMRKAYSPWSSKIYNLRQIPELHRNNHPHNAI